MSVSKHTPGPWVLDESVYGDNFAAVSTPTHGELATVAIRMSEPSWDERQKTAELEANAYLIAAAPELLEALELLVDNPYRDGTESDERLRRIGRAAIAKAKGETRE